jgi:hypothetical protein
MRDFGKDLKDLNTPLPQLSPLRAGVGFLVPCAKPEEVDVWRAYADANGRSKSFIVFDQTKSVAFDDEDVDR